MTLASRGLSRAGGIIAVLTIVLAGAVARGEPASLGDWIVVSVEAGASGATYDMALLLQGYHDASKPRANGIWVAAGHPRTTLALTSFNHGDGNRVRTTRTLGNHDIVMEERSPADDRIGLAIFSGGRLTAGDSVSFLMAYPHGGITTFEPGVTIVSGNATVAVSSGVGSEAPGLLDESDGAGVEAKGAAAGAIISDRFYGGGMVGAFNVHCVCTMGWVDPDGRTGSISMVGMAVEPDNVGAFVGVGDRMISGAGGNWRFTWSGATSGFDGWPGAGSPMLGIFVPVGANRTLFPSTDHADWIPPLPQTP